MHPVSPRLIHKINADRAASRYFEGLQYQIEISLQAGRIADHYHRVTLFKAEEIPCHPLLFGVSGQRICTRQVCDRYLRVKSASAKGVCNRFARPVARMLFEPRQAVKDGAFANVGVARQGNHHSVTRRRPIFSGGPSARRLTRKSHSHLSLSERASASSDTDAPLSHRFHDHAFGIITAQSNHRTPYAKCRRLAEHSSVDTFHPSARNQPDILQPSAHRSSCGHRNHRR